MHLRTSSTSPPDWEAVDEEILCPLCDYNLRGLSDPRCPECGYRFVWPELLDPTRRHHPYVFEHHPRHNLRSFLRTVWGAMRPGRFWRSLHPAQPSRPKRLLLFWAINTALILLLSLTIFIFPAIDQARVNRQARQNLKNYILNPRNVASVSRMTLEYGSIDGFMDAFAPRPWSWTFVANLFSTTVIVRELIPLMIAYLGWPVLTFVALMVFRWSMRRARVNTKHVLRCVVYSFDAVAWGIFVMAVSAWHVTVPAFLAARMPGVTGPLFVLVCIGAAIMAYRLFVAYRLYLRFDRPLATIVTSQIIVALTMLCLLIQWYLTI